MKTSHRTLAAAGLLLAATQVVAAPLVPGAWQSFDFYDDIDNAAWVDGNLDLVSFEVSLTAPAYLHVVDIGFSGDRFEVFANGVSLGTTSAPVDAGDTDQGLDFDAAFADSRWSQKVFALAAGNYTITGRAIDLAPDTFGGTGGIRLVPEPSTCLLLGAGLAGLGLTARRRTHTFKGE